MSVFLAFAYLFFIGSTVGWCIELIYRRFFSRANPDRRWINPGFCVGPYLPLYGCGLCVLCLTAQAGEAILPDGIGGEIILIICMAIFMTGIEYIAGIVSLHFLHLRLWDYSREWGNLQGIICPRFTFYWGVLAALYRYFVHPDILAALNWLSRNLAFSFVIGFFFGVFVIDVAYSTKLVGRMKRFAAEHDVIVRYENLKALIRRRQEQRKEQIHFLFPFASPHTLNEHLREFESTMEKHIRGLHDKKK